MKYIKPFDHMKGRSIQHLVGFTLTAQEKLNPVFTFFGLNSTLHTLIGNNIMSLIPLFLGLSMYPLSTRIEMN